MTVVSINIAREEQIISGEKTVPTGIHKRPVAGSATVSRYGVDGDTIVDTTVHGGLDQAVYLYSSADYAWWEQQLKCEIAPGTFGENLTLEAFPAAPLKIGDRLTINNVVMEITAPRVPCFKLAARMQDPTFGKKFVAAVKPGAYARVLTEGTVTVGDAVAWWPTQLDFATVEDIFIEWHKKDWSRSVFEQALASPLSSIAREIIARKIAV